MACPEGRYGDIVLDGLNVIAVGTFTATHGRVPK